MNKQIQQKNAVSYKLELQQLAKTLLLDESDLIELYNPQKIDTLNKNNRQEINRFEGFHGQLNLNERKQKRDNGFSKYSNISNLLNTQWNSKAVKLNIVRYNQKKEQQKDKNLSNRINQKIVKKENFKKFQIDFSLSDDLSKKFVSLQKKFSDRKSLGSRLIKNRCMTQHQHEKNLEYINEIDHSKIYIKRLHSSNMTIPNNNSTNDYICNINTNFDRLKHRQVNLHKKNINIKKHSSNNFSLDGITKKRIKSSNSECQALKNRKTQQQMAKLINRIKQLNNKSFKTPFLHNQKNAVSLLHPINSQSGDIGEYHQSYSLKRPKNTIKNTNFKVKAQNLSKISQTTNYIKNRGLKALMDLQNDNLLKIPASCKLLQC